MLSPTEYGTMILEQYHTLEGESLEIEARNGYLCQCELLNIIKIGSLYWMFIFHMYIHVVSHGHRGD